MSLPALILAEAGTASLPVVALPVLERLVIACHRAGCAPITIVTKDMLPPMKRARALGITSEVAADVPASLKGPLLLARGNVLVYASDVSRVIAHGGRLATSQGKILPLGITDKVSADVEGALESKPLQIAQGAAALVEDVAGAREASKLLWCSLTSSADGPMDRLVNRPLGRFLSRVLVHTPITPNQITLAAMFIGVFAAWFFSRGTGNWPLWGALVFQLSAIIDCVDGDIARSLYKETSIGKWLDIGADQVVHLSLFAAIAVGVHTAGSGAPVLLLGGSAAAGALISFLVVLRGMLQSEDKRNPKLAKLIDTATNRDFSYLLIVLAAIGRLEFFLWLAAIGSHVFWLMALSIQLLSHKPVQEAA